MYNFFKESCLHMYCVPQHCYEFHELLGWRWMSLEHDSLWVNFCNRQLGMRRWSELVMQLCFLSKLLLLFISSFFVIKVMGCALLQLINSSSSQAFTINFISMKEVSVSTSCKILNFNDCLIHIYIKSWRN